jgi:hypothetical protein
MPLKVVAIIPEEEPFKINKMKTLQISSSNIVKAGGTHPGD